MVSNPSRGTLPYDSQQDKEVHIEPVYRAYETLVATMTLDAEFGLGGKLLYVGEIAESEGDLMLAGNIAGAASLAACADPAAQRQMMRDGVVDFVVTSLGEALRILKNEIRKRQPVSVAVGVPQSELVAEMLERGVLPDLLSPVSARSDAAAAEMFMAQGARRVENIGVVARLVTFVSWSVERQHTRWLSKIDECARKVVDEDDFIRQRWLQLAPRYLGRRAQLQHGAPLSPGEKERFEDEVRQWMARHKDESGGRVAVTVLSEATGD